MNAKSVLIEEIVNAPEELVRQVLDFVRFLRSKEVSALRATALASEEVLQRDWMSAEEDSAWRDL
jgi:hypothetical protein